MREVQTQVEVLVEFPAFYEGSQEAVYGLLTDIKRHFQIDSEVRNRSQTDKQLHRPKSPQIKIEKYQRNSKFCLSIPMKNRIIEWVKKLDLLHRIIFHEDPRKNSLENGDLVCEVIQRVFKARIPISPSETEENCTKNIDCVLSFLRTYPKFQEKLPKTSKFPFGDLSWKLLWEVMNNCSELIDTYDSDYVKELEKKIVSWTISLDILPYAQISLTDLIPYMQSGVLLIKLVKKLFPAELENSYAKFPNRYSEGMKNICRAVSALGCVEAIPKKNLDESQIYAGNNEVCVGLIEDLFQYCNDQDIKMLSKYSGKLEESKGESRAKVFNSNCLIVEKIEEWLRKIGISGIGLSGKVLKQFNNGKVMIEISGKLCGKYPIEIVDRPKTFAEALENIRSALRLLGQNFKLPVKYQYFDDQILAGNGAVIRSLLKDLMNMSSDML